MRDDCGLYRSDLRQPSSASSGAVRRRTGGGRRRIERPGPCLPARPRAAPLPCRRTASAGAGGLVPAIPSGNVRFGFKAERSATSATSGLSRSVKRRSRLGPFETFVIRGCHSMRLWRSTLRQAQRLLYLREFFRPGAIRKADEPHGLDQPLALRFAESRNIDKSLDGQIGKPPECVRY